MRHRRVLHFDTIDEGIAAVDALNAKEGKGALAHPQKHWRWAIESWGEVAGERPADEDLWHVAARREMPSPGTSAHFMVTPSVVRAERWEQIFGYIAVIFGVLGSLALILAGLTEIIGEAPNAPSFAFGAIAGVLCGLAAGWAYRWNERGELPLSEKYRDPQVIELYEWTERTRWTRERPVPASPDPATADY